MCIYCLYPGSDVMAGGMLPHQALIVEDPDYPLHDGESTSDTSDSDDAYRMFSTCYYIITTYDCYIEARK